MGYSFETTGAAGAALSIVAVVLIAYLVTFGLGIAVYILQSLGLYTIAQRRGIKNPWMAWLPMTNMWILGSIADQYRYVALGQIRNRRKVLLGLLIGAMAVWVAFFCVYIGMIFKFIMRIPDLEAMEAPQILQHLGPSVAWIGIIMLIWWIVGMTAMVFQYICLYDLYASCSPDHKVLFLVLSILVNITMPVIVFVCRKKDDGMPPRKEEVLTALPAELMEAAEE